MKRRLAWVLTLIALVMVPVSAALLSNAGRHSKRYSARISGTYALVEAQGLLPVTGWIWLPAEAGVPLLAAGVAALAALLPAVQAYRTDVADLLSQP